MHKFSTDKKFSIKTKRKAYLINLLNDKNLTIKKLDINEEEVSFFVSQTQTKLATQLLEKEKFEFDITPKPTFATGKIFVLSFIIPFVLFLVTTFIFSNFLLRFDVSCENAETKSKIEKIVQTKTQFLPKSKFSTDDLEKTILNEINEISYCSVAYKGSTVVVNTKLKLSNIEYADKNDYAPIISPVEGYIEELEVLSGTPNCRVGSYVSVGDVLIFPYILSSDHKKMPILAKGKIKIRSFSSSKKTISEQTVKMVRTGNFVENFKIESFGKSIYQTDSKIDFKNFEVQEHSVCISNGNILPIYKQTTIVYELVPKVINFNLETKSEGVLHAIEESLKKSLPANAKIEKINKKTKNNLGVIDFIVDIEYYLNID